ncbi:MAG: lysophospholipid acyltransferase family protein [Oceanicaulis sp.]
MTDFTSDRMKTETPETRPMAATKTQRPDAETLIRSSLYEVAYWVITVIAALACTILALVPGRRLLGWGLQMYGSAQVAALKYVAGVHIQVRGRERLPAGPAVIAAKHQSWGDGFVMLSEIARLGFVSGDHLLKFPLVGRILRKAGAIVLSNQGGEEARARLQEGIDSMLEDPRDLLIYPEGHLSAPGEMHRYRTGVWRLYDALQRPCTPVATSLGLAWDRQSFIKRKGRVVVEFLDPIEPGMDKDAFMAKLESVIEARTNALVGEGL